MKRRFVLSCLAAFALIAGLGPPAGCFAAADTSAYRDTLEAIVGRICQDTSINLGGKVSAGGSLEATAEGELISGVDCAAGIRADVEAALSASLKAGLWAEEGEDGGLYIGAIVEAGAYLKAGVEGTVSVNFFGIRTVANVRADVTLGASLEASAYMKIGYDAQVAFVVDASLTVGVGCSITADLSVNVFDLMEHVVGSADLERLDDLIEWASAFLADPIGYVKDMLSDFIEEALIEAGWAVLTNIAEWIWDKLNGLVQCIFDMIGSFLDWITGFFEEGAEQFTPQLGDFM